MNTSSLTTTATGVYPVCCFFGDVHRIFKTSREFDVPGTSSRLSSPTPPPKPLEGTRKKGLSRRGVRLCVWEVLRFPECKGRIYGEGARLFVDDEPRQIGQAGPKKPNMLFAPNADHQKMSTPGFPPRRRCYRRQSALSRWVVTSAAGRARSMWA